MGLYVETTESAAPTLLVLSQETILVRITLCGIDTTCHGLTAIEREQPGEPVAGNPLGGFCEGGRAQVTNPRDLSLPTTPAAAEQCSRSRSSQALIKAFVRSSLPPWSGCSSCSALRNAVLSAVKGNSSAKRDSGSSLEAVGKSFIAAL